MGELGHRQRRVRSLSLPAGPNGGETNRNGGETNRDRSSPFPFPRGTARGKKSSRFPVLLGLIVLGMVGLQWYINTTTTDYYSVYESHSSLSAEELYNRALEMASNYGMDSGSSGTGGTNDNHNINNINSNNAYECTIPRFHIHSQEAKGLGSTVGPVLLEGWKDFDPNHWTQSALMARVGDFPQYLKDLTVQPLQRTKKDDESISSNNNNNNNNKKKKQSNHIRTAATSDFCVLKSRDVADLLSSSSSRNPGGGDTDLLFFTNNKENKPFMKQLRPLYQVPSLVQHIEGFEVFSAMGESRYHSIHAHGESWIGQVSGRRMWWFLPPGTSPKPERVDACGYLTGQYELPPKAQRCVQNPGEIVWFPKDWLHATCALDDWTVGIGAQQGRTIRQNFPKLDPHEFEMDASQYDEQKTKTLDECLGVVHVDPTQFQASKWAAEASSNNKNNNNKKANAAKADDKDWAWFDGDLNAYYNSLEKQIHDRDPSKIASYAVHRWMGPNRSTEEHYELIDRAIAAHHRFPQPQDQQQQQQQQRALKVFDGGCGLGSALMFFNERHPDWDLTGHTISEEQYKFIQAKLPKHSFRANLRSYDDIEEGLYYDVIFSIEALIHSADVVKTMREWAAHLEPGGIVIVIDDYVAEGVNKNDEDVQSFSKSWLANVLITPIEFQTLAKTFGLELVENRDLLAEYEIVKRNYRNHKPVIKPVADRNHQGWMGSKWRQRLTVEGKLNYNMIVLQKSSSSISDSPRRLNDDVLLEPAGSEVCAGVPSIPTHQDGTEEPARALFTEITPQLMSGRGRGGGQKIACISGWYCCNKGLEWYDHLQAHRTDNTAFLKLDRNLFGHYVDVFAKHLNDFYKTYPASFPGGRFLDIGGTGSTASGMTKVTSKFQHFAGPLEYWKLDSDKAAKNLERTLFCDIDDCPAAEDCGFDVTFSHTVLEHAKRPWKSFDTIARITKKGGLTMHLVPWSYQYHATPDDNYRFSHTALVTLLEDRGFDVLEVGYDICTKPEKMKNRIDEHYDVIWLSYVVGRKR